MPRHPGVSPTAYPQDVKDQALAIYVEEGSRIAAEATGVKRKTILTWAYRAGLKTNYGNSTRAATEIMVQEHAERRAELREKLLEDAHELANRLVSPYTDVLSLPYRGHEVLYTLDKPHGAATKQLASALVDVVRSLRLEGEQTTANTAVTWQHGMDLDAEIAAFAQGAASAIEQNTAEAPAEDITAGHARVMAADLTGRIGSA